MAAAKKVEHRNVVVLVGTVSRPAAEREIADGQTFVELDVRVSDPLGTTTVPVTWPGGDATVDAGAEVLVVGRVRRRFWQSGGAPVSRTDVLAYDVLPASSRKVTAALAAAAEQVSG